LRMISKKYLFYPAFFIVLALMIYFALSAYINYIYVPKKITPIVSAHINSDSFKPLEISVSEVAFHPFRGFILHDLIVKSPTTLQGNDLLRARLVDVDIAFLPLLWKKIHIKRLRIIGADLTIGRDVKGVWNFSHIKDVYYAKCDDRFDVTISEMSLPRCNMIYMDYFKKDNFIEREFDNIKVRLNRYAGTTYRVTISGSDKDRLRESISLTLFYDAIKNSAKGKARLATTYANDYWEYYLDEALKPWRVTCETAKLDTTFSYADNVWTLDGNYLIDKAILSYGEAAITADIVVGHELTYFSNSANRAESHIEARLKDVSSLLGNYRLLDDGRCYIIIENDQINIQDISGSVNGQPVTLTGEFIFGDQRKLVLSGTIADVKHDFCLNLPTYTYGTAYWDLKKDDSFVNITADMQDLKDSVFSLTVNGDISVPDLSTLLNIDKEDTSGAINFSGHLKGEADELESLQGKLSVIVDELSLFKLQPVSFHFDMKAKDGIFEGEMPPAHFYKGDIRGKIRTDMERLGAELYIDGLDLEEFSKVHPKLKSMTGQLAGSISFISKTKDICDTVKGYVSIVLRNCDLRNTPLFSSVEKSMKNFDENFTMPVFKRAEVILLVMDRCLNVNYAFFDADGLNVHFLGKVTFDGIFDITAGTKIFGAGFLKKLLLPHLLGFNLLKDVVEINVVGKWPNLRSVAKVEPMAWLNEFFGFGKKARPEKYNLDKLWAQY